MKKPSFKCTPKSVRQWHSLGLASAILVIIAGVCFTTVAAELFSGALKDEGVTRAGEGPAWSPDGRLHFSGDDRITRLEPDGTTTVYRHPSGHSNGLLFDSAGRLVVCEGGRRRVTRTEADGSIIVLADSFDGKRFNTPNDLAIDSKGRIYFTDPRYGNREGMEQLDGSGRQIEGVYRIDAPGHVSRIITHEVDRPNGILISPDDRYLYVADNNNNTIGGARKLWRFDLNPDGTVEPGSRILIFDWETGRGPDGIKMDQQGRLFVAAGLNRPNPPFESAEKFKGGIYVLSPESKLLGFIRVPADEVTNCAFGDADLKTLFITGGNRLWSIRVNTPGRVSFQHGRPRAAAPHYNLLIRGGKIVDGTGNPWRYGDVAIQGDRIAAVGQLANATADRIIDARNRIVAPGFVDVHSHSDWLLLEDGDAQSKIRQGVTTEILGEGNSVGPFQGKLPVREVSVGTELTKITRVRDYFDAVERAGIAVNVATYVGIDNLWQAVMGKSFSRPSWSQLNEMKRLLAEAMEDGALGLSTMLMMPPGSLVTTDHLVELATVAKRYGGIYSTHIRNEGLGVFESIREAIEIGERAQIPVDIIHLKIADQKLWGRMPEVAKLIASARERGIEVHANVYPYTRGNNNLSSIIPPWAHEGGTDAMLQRLRDSQLRDRLKHDIRHGLPDWYNHYTAVGGDWKRMLISADSPYKGMTMDQVIAALDSDSTKRTDPLDILIRLLIEHGGSVSTVYAHHTEEDMTTALVQPWCSVGSDGSAYAIEGPLRRGNPHPRNFGTFPRLLGIYVRERGVLSLEDAIRKITSLNAAKVGLHDRGWLRAASFADVTIFDFNTVVDKSTYTDPFHYNEGIEYVIVNGSVVLDRGHHTGARPGRALRRSH